MRTQCRVTKKPLALRGNAYARSIHTTATLASVCARREMDAQRIVHIVAKTQLCTVLPGTRATFRARAKRLTIKFMTDRKKSQTATLDRREFLLGGGAVVALSGCHGAPPAGDTARARSHGENRMQGQLQTTATSQPRRVRELIDGMPTSDGAGVRLTRVIGQPRLRNLDPFLMLDQFRSDDPNAYIAGFPDHPHRGFETITVMLDGRMRHRDSRGNSGLITGGGIQWMTAGRGIVHSEMPEQEHGLMSGFQLWLNLPREEKMCAPFYQDMQADSIAIADLDNRGSARVIAGDAFGVRGVIRPRPSEPLLADIRLHPGHKVRVPIPTHHASFAFVYQGTAKLGGTDVPERKLAILHPGDSLELEAGADGAGILLAAGKPFAEPIVQHGPFVMNTDEEIQRAFYDYRAGTLGHE